MFQQRCPLYQLTGCNMCTSRRSCEMRRISKTTCLASTSTTAVKLHTIKKSACMISYKSGASRVLWCSSCCAAWGAHGQLTSMTIKVLWELRGPVGSGFYAVMSITQTLSCGFPHPVSLRLGSLHFPQCLPSTSNPTSRIYPLSRLFSGKGKKVGDTLLLDEDSEGLQVFEMWSEPLQTCHCDLQSMKILFGWCAMLWTFEFGIKNAGLIDFPAKHGFNQQGQLYQLKAKLLLAMF